MAVQEWCEDAAFLARVASLLRDTMGSVHASRPERAFVSGALCAIDEMRRALEEAQHEGHDRGDVGAAS